MSFFYELPSDRIAQRPVYPPESAKLLVYNRALDQIIDSQFLNITEFCDGNEIFIFNNSKVIPARLFGKLFGKDVELLLVKRVFASGWNCIGKPLKKFHPNSTIKISSNSKDIEGKILIRISEKEVLVEFNVSDTELFQAGSMPIPPYIRDGKSDQADVIDYQSIFAKHEGSVAAPTASLHFSKNLIEKLIQKNIQIKEITLHVGTASFLPLSEHPGTELFQYDLNLLEFLLSQKKLGKKIVAVGTTSVRALESMINLYLNNSNNENNSLIETDLFIEPGYQFKLVDNLITNFHQPQTTHLLLVSALCGQSKLQEIYSHALQIPQYRFLSYGDGMFII